MYKFEKETYNGAHIIPGTVLGALYTLLFFNSTITQIITII